jgi:hypothetical protein
MLAVDLEFVVSRPRKDLNAMQAPKASLLNRYPQSNISLHRPCCRSRKLKFGVAAIGLLALSSLALGRGNSGGHMFGPANQGNQGNPTRHEGYYRDPFWGPWYRGSTGYYDSDYWYTPTPEQKSTAQKRVQDYLTAVKKGKRRAATHHYIAVETLKPTKKQLEDYAKKRAEAKSAAVTGGNQLSDRWVEPSQLRCVMVFDTRSNQFVGSGCYVIGSLPPVGTVAKFETVSAEYVGTNAL